MVGNSIEALVGQTIRSIKGAEDGSFEVVIETDHLLLTMEHQLDCCENVRVEDVTGDPGDLIGCVVSVAEERTEDSPNDWGSGTWTFYEIRTTGGDLTIRWLGESNGYYSEGVSIFVKAKE